MSQALDLPARGGLSAYLRALRPRQWMKNVAVLAAVVFAEKLTDPASARQAFVTLLAFCALGSATYLANDIADRERDRLHPTKKHRPIAAGLIPVGTASVLSAILALTGITVCLLVNERTAILGGAYLALQVAYTTRLKHVVLFDVASIAAGFVLRVAAGALAVSVPISNWLYLCTLLLSLFLALGKRRHELEVLEGDAAMHRGALARYSVPLVDQMMTAVTASLIVTYALYTMSDETIRRFGSDRLSWTVPIVIYGLFRYLYLVHREGAGGAPEKVLTGDRPLLATCAVYGLVVLGIVYL